MHVRAKFFVNSIRHLHSHDPIAEVVMSPVYGDGKANDVWSKATPQGEIKMLITAPAAVEQFELGKEYFVDFTPAE